MNGLTATLRTVGGQTIFAATRKVSVVARNAGYDYDANGNMTTDGQFEYVWDNADRLKEVRKDGQVVMTCRYDDTLGGAGGIGGILSCSTSATSTVYYHYDANGNVIACTDADGALVSHLEYSPFGKVMLNSGSYVPRYQFSSKEFDAAVGLNYYGFRYYSPQLGRWLNRDPVSDESFLRLQLANPDWQDKRKIERQFRNAALKPLYVYVENRPISEFDPFGLDNSGGGGQNEPIDPTFGCWIDPPERICGAGNSFRERCCRFGVEIIMLLDPGAHCQGSATACEVCCGTKLLDDPTFSESHFDLCINSCELKRVACTGGL
ncbi:MAG: hypothetical protein M9935_04140 [Kiritimatiellae bacterium]|nr:hypothetical protein [Kiritimatiellia bacterium]